MSLPKSKPPIAAFTLTRTSRPLSVRPEFVAQLDENLGALANLDFTPDELADIDRYASGSGIDLWNECLDV